MKQERVGVDLAVSGILFQELVPKVIAFVISLSVTLCF